ncbi:hypothetical protein L4C54_12990 [Vibrio lamellibrachiae]|uniref:hypothetical protein n=1 Tax=Vibrio lamellibrachiae TaxID=2910253 RepID=UPI003D14CF8B
MATLHHYPNILKNAVSIADFANIFIGLVAIATLGFSLWDRHVSTIVRQSNMALESYVDKVDSTIEKLSKDNLTSDKMWFFILSAYESLYATQKYISTEEHKHFAIHKFEELRTHLKLIYHDLQLEHFMDVPKEVREKKDLKSYNNTFEAYSYIFSASWLKYVAPRVSYFEKTRQASYGYQWCTEPKYIYSLMALLTSARLDIPHIKVLGDQITTLAKESRTDGDSRLCALVESYPKLFTHIFLSNSCKAWNKPGHYTRILQLAVYGPEEAWFVIDKAPGTFSYGFYHKLNYSRYLVKKDNSKKIKVKEYG